MAVLFTRILHAQLTSYALDRIGKPLEDEEEKVEPIRAKSRQAAIAKYGEVMVAAAERWARQHHPQVGSGLGKVGSYEYLIGMYRSAYRRAMWQPAPRQRSKPATRPPIPMLEIRSTLRAIERLHDAPSRPFVGAYLLEARRHELVPQVGANAVGEEEPEYLRYFIGSAARRHQGRRAQKTRKAP